MAQRILRSELKEKKIKIKCKELKGRILDKEMKRK